MKILSIQDVYQKKFDRQKRIKELSYHAAGHCVHLGKISPGCYGCFVPDRYRKNISVGNKCNLDCAYCTQEKIAGKKRGAYEITNLLFKDITKKLLLESIQPDYQPLSISFSGGGEPLMHLNVISDFMCFFHDLHKNLKKKPWYYLYTNGTLADEDTLLRLKDLNFDEIRFHLGSTNFSGEVYKNMRNAVKYFKAISVETPAWPFHRKKLFDMLPKIEDIGVKHLNITEVEINKDNFKRISALLGEGEICQCGELQLYDGGLVYDIIEEVIRKRYSYSVLDCNCFVKSIQRTLGKWIFHEDVKGLCAEY
ncbi:MAG: radical SAM protein [Candidatus Omnitrophota bacterium]|jgi:pyruvate formate-lyase activating enzyme-like uncharacterized protein